MNFSVAEFRKNIREALDAVERGEDVHITRHNKTFAIVKAPFNYLTTDKVSSNIRPDIPTPQKNTPVATQHSEASIVDPEEIRNINIPPLPEGKIVVGTTPPGPNEFLEALDAAEQKCCRLKSPCRHWQFDGEDWVNTLSGRKREVEQ